MIFPHCCSVGKVEDSEWGRRRILGSPLSRVSNYKQSPRIKDPEILRMRFTGMLPMCEGLSYSDRLDRLELFSLDRRRMRGDHMEVYTIMRGIDRVDTFTQNREIKNQRPKV